LETGNLLRLGGNPGAPEGAEWVPQRIAQSLDGAWEPVKRMRMEILL